ncbi:diguanylate cyclase [Pseudooceanicola nanhaiensis]|uniref:diguanylate cyclase n=1 Tax=Pseudooceanicola nanhaiensis TaxID=375761 RepID=UPI001CD658AF|nr:diguanylate cyclase [Pseudooceanicola nanhaiensis]MCA0920112.1 diguanylate cyclase [Pseudooceanicola nanhaiensis]
MEKVLIIDGSTMSRLGLKARLSMTYPDVVEADSADAALQALRDGPPPDLIVLTDGGLCRPAADLLTEIRASPAGRHAAVVMLTHATDSLSRVRLLEAGADDVAPRTEAEGRFYARMRGLLRARAAAEELRLRDATGVMLGMAETAEEFRPAPRPAQVTIVAQDRATAVVWQAALSQRAPHAYQPLSMSEALRWAAPMATGEIFVIDLDAVEPKQVTVLISDIRSREDTRHAEVLVVTREPDNPAAGDALDLGAGALMSDGFDPAEMLLRLGVLMRRKRTAEALRRRLADGMRASVTDALTGLYNRRYALPHLHKLAAGAALSGTHFAVIVADIDHFKSVNDRFGHAGGDIALVAVADLLRDNLRAADTVARIGGEEFLILMPDAGRAEAAIASERLRRRVAETPIHLPGQAAPLHCTISLGITLATGADGEDGCAVDRLLARADRALYAAKAAGRDRVLFDDTPCFVGPRPQAAGR